LHVLKSYSTKTLINEFPQKGWRLSSLNYLLKNCKKPAQQIDSRAVAHLAHHILLRTLMQSMIWCSVRRVHQGRTKLPVRSPGKLAFRRSQWCASYTKTFSESAWRNDLSWSGIQQSITDQAINQWRNRLNACAKAKGKHSEHLLWCVCP